MAAQNYAREHYGPGLGTLYTLVTITELSEPSGVHYGAEFPERLQFVGDFGFFVARADGTVTALGTGDIARAMYDVGSEAPMDDLLRAILRRRGARS